MFDHVTIRVSDREASERFYDTVLAVLGIDQSHRDNRFTQWGDFGVVSSSEEHPVTRGLHIGFVASSPERIDEFWQAGRDCGYLDDGAPGPRPEYGEDYYGGFLLDPDGNSVEAAHHDARRRDGHVDHLWIRVADVAASKRFYVTVAPHAGFELSTDTPERAQFGRGNGSFSVLVDGEPTANLHVAFPVTEDAAVDAFHRDALAAGYRNNGAPGERAIYHPGYYGAYVLDPDGNNVELVNHHYA